MNPHVYLHEIIYTVPGREEPYAASVLSLRYDPGRRRGGEVHPPLAQLRTAETSGHWPGVINIWENTWQGQMRSLEGQFQDTRRDTTMEDWWNRNLHLRRGGYDRLLVPAEYSPTGEQLRSRGVRAEVLVHEVVWLPFGEPQRYLEKLERELLPVAARLGIELIGAWRVAMRPRQVLTLLGAREWTQLGRFLEAAATDPQLRAWSEYRSRTVARAEELVLLPVRHDPLATRVH